MKTKHARTLHVEFSPGISDDDKVLESYAGFEGCEIVVTEKMDGECTSVYPDGHIHARSIDSANHPSRNWVKGFLSGISHLLPLEWRLVGENLYAQHSLRYEALPSYFMGYFLWDENNVALPWDTMLEWFQLLGVEPVPLLYRGPFDLRVLRELAKGIDTERQEGFVVRVSGRIPFEEFGSKVAKWVRPGHVQTDEHWMSKPVVPNGLRRTGTP